MPNSTSTSYVYDDLNRVTHITNTSSVSGTLSFFQYGMDNVGNRLAVTDTAGTTSYAYDRLYRLTLVTHPDASGQGYGYDAVGNRTTITDTSWQTGLGYTYDAADRGGWANGTWDDNGNLLTGDDVTYQYNSANWLTTVVSGTLIATYEYNADGLRTAMTANGVRTSYLWDVNASLPVIITDSTSIYIYGLSLIARQTGSDVEYYHTDALGSTRSLTNGSGQNVGAYSFKPFGEPLFTEGSSSNRFQYTGQLSDLETGSYYLRARYYQGGAGRFITRDPFRGYPEQPQSLNPYAYVMNDPLRYTDPTGYDWWDDAIKAAESFTQGFSDQYVYAWSDYRREGFGEDPSDAYHWGRLAGQGLSNAEAYMLMASGQGMMNLSGRWLCPSLPLIPGTSIGKPQLVLVGGQLVYVTGAVMVAQGAGVVGRNALNQLAFSKKDRGAEGTERKTNISKSESTVWRDLDNYRGDIKTSESGKNKRYYKWDHTHNDIEVYDAKGDHIGSMHPTTGELYKPPVEGRNIRKEIR